MVNISILYQNGTFNIHIYYIIYDLAGIYAKNGMFRLLNVMGNGQWL